MNATHTRLRTWRARTRGPREHAPPLAPGVPSALRDPDTLVSGAVVATLLAHSGDWVRSRTERIALGARGSVRREVSVDLELPGLAWAAVPRGEPVLVPLALAGKERAPEVLDPQGEGGEPLDVLSREAAAEVMAAGLVAVAQGAGAPVRDDLRTLAWRIAAGTPQEAEAAVAELAAGASPGAARAWSHAPFRELAETLVDRLPLIVSVLDADRRRVLRYSYEDHAAGSPPPRALRDRVARALGWREARFWCPLPTLGDARAHRFEVVPGLDLEASAELAAAAPGGGAVVAGSGGFARTASVGVETPPRGSRGVLSLRVRARRADLLRAEPLVPLLAALLLTGGWLGLPIVGAGGRNAMALVVAAPAILAAYLGRPWGHPVLRELLRGARLLTIAAGAVSFAAAVTLASGAAESVQRAALGAGALVAWGLAALLLDTRRRVTGTPILTSPFPERTAGQRAEDATVAAPATTRTDSLRLAGLAVAIAVGLLIVAAADDTARAGHRGAYGLLWLGLLAIFVPALVYALRVRSRREAIVAVVLAGVGLYLVKVLHSPSGFTFHDEFSTLRTTVDIERFGEPFHHSPLIPVHPFYPAIELVTSAVSTVTGASTFVSALLVIGVLRVALMAGLFLVFEAASSTRVAAVAAVLYAANPNFVFFDSQWAYESFALPLAAVAIAMVAVARRRAGPRRTVWLTLPIVVTITVAHPLTSLALVLFLAAWAAIDALFARRDGRERRRDLAVLAAVGGVFLVGWVTVVAQKTGGYLGPVLRSAGSSLVDLVLGHGGPKRIFEAAGVPKTPIPEQLLGFAAVAIALAVVGLGVRLLWRRFEPLTATLALAALVYPLSLPLRLTEDGTEISNRASEFVFIGIAFLGALIVVEGTRRLPAKRVRLARAAVPAAVAAAAILFMGGVVIGWARYARLPGSYMVIGDSRSVEPVGIAAARWSRQQLGTGNRVVADRANGLLWGAYGLQEPQGGSIIGRSVPRTVTAPVVDADVKYALVKDDLRFLVVDRRLSTGLPAVGFYFERDEPGAYEHRRPPAPGALTKYDRVCPVGRALDSGPIVVYDTRRMAGQFECATGPGPVAPKGPRIGGGGAGVPLPGAPRPAGPGPAHGPAPGGGGGP